MSWNVNGVRSILRKGFLDFLAAEQPDILCLQETKASRKPVVFCGDFNVARTELDLARPKQNVGTHGFTDEERAGFEAFVRAGFRDTFREFESGPGHYTWWSVMTGARPKNIGWRIDYVMISRALRPKLKAAFIRQEVAGSDHCPVGVELDMT